MGRKAFRFLRVSFYSFVRRKIEFKFEIDCQSLSFEERERLQTNLGAGLTF